MAHETSIEALNEQPSSMAARQFEIEFFAPGVEALTFTFGCSTSDIRTKGDGP
jgi:hypothetical protein